MQTVYYTILAHRTPCEFFGLKENAWCSSEREMLTVLNRENNSAAGTLEASALGSADRVEV